MSISHNSLQTLLGVALGLSVSACAADGSTRARSLSCFLATPHQRQLEQPPSNAPDLRGIAMLHPNDPNSFGPPPSQQHFSGSRWNTNNEYWYSADNGDVLLYVNSDDNFVYMWHFEGSSTRLKEHMLVDCGG